jgi:predicted nucleotidyltransferase
MADYALQAAERAFLRALNEFGVRYLIVGVTAASMQGARVGTEDVDLWFADTSDPKIGEAARRAGGLWISGSFGMQPPTIGGGLGDRFDVVLTMSGLDGFDAEYARARVLDVDGIGVHVLPLERIIHSKRAANRAKDRAALPALEAALAVEQDEATK